MKIEFNYQTSVMTLPASVVDKLDGASETDLRVLLYLASKEELREQFDAARLAVALDLPPTEIELSVAFWRGAGVIKAGRSKAQSKVQPAPSGEKAHDAPPVILAREGLPDYTGKEIEELLARRETLSKLLRECEKLLGKVFNVAESNKMIALTDYLHLSDEYILTLCGYCARLGKGRANYVAATAKELVTAGVTSVDELEAYIDKEERSHDFENYMRQLLGLGGAKLTPRQKGFLANWQNMNFPREVFAFAYETSVDATSALSLPHLNKILESFLREGVKTLEDAKKAQQKHKEETARSFATSKGKKKGDNAEFKSFDADDFFRTAVDQKPD